MLEILNHPSSVFALLGVLLLILGFIRISREHLDTRTLVFTALMLALAVILQQLRIFHMPQGGSVTLGAMVPLLLVAYRYGMGVGLLAGFLFGLIDMMQDPYILHPVQVLFDYPLPFMAMGLAGWKRNHIYLGTLLAFCARFLCHFISGVVFFASYAPEGTAPWLYSLTFNATYLIPEFLICCLILKLLPLRRILHAMGR